MKNLKTNIKTSIYNLFYRFLTFEKRIDKIISKPKYIKLNISDYRFWQKEYKKWITIINTKVKNQEKVKVAFIIYWVNSFSADAILNKMYNDKIFEPEIIIVPTELVYSKEKAIEVYKENLKIIKHKYKDKFKINEAYDTATGNIIDLTKNFDIIFTPSNDERIAPKEYKIYNFIKNRILTCYTGYAYYAAIDDSILSDTYNLCWKVFIENELNYKDLEQRQPLNGKNACISGYVKTDNFFGLKKQSKSRHMIIIAPHHSIHELGLCSRFLEYSDLFLRLPVLYPDIDFVFRPHPLLINTLSSHDFWGEEKTNNYFEKLLSYPNIKYDTSSEYYQTFINSDGIIHDCGSFLPEYLFTGNPGCYMLKNKEAIDKYYNEFGKECLKHYYQAYNEDDIIKFIENVVNSGNDIKREKRKEFLNKVLNVNYPHVSDYIVSYIKGKIK